MAMQGQFLLAGLQPATYSTVPILLHPFISPMAKFLITSGIVHETDDLVRHAERELFLVTPFIQLSMIAD